VADDRQQPVFAGQRRGRMTIDRRAAAAEAAVQRPDAGEPTRRGVEIAQPIERVERAGPQPDL